MKYSTNWWYHIYIIKVIMSLTFTLHLISEWTRNINRCKSPKWSVRFNHQNVSNWSTNVLIIILVINFVYLKIEHMLSNLLALLYMVFNCGVKRHPLWWALGSTINFLSHKKSGLISIWHFLPKVRFLWKLYSPKNNEVPKWLPVNKKKLTCLFDKSYF